MAAAPKKQIRPTSDREHHRYEPSASRQILIVDDDRDVRELLKSCLEYEGFHVETAQNLDEMRSRLKQQRFDAVLLDIFLNSENGLQALPELVGNHPLMKVILMTGHGSVDLAVQAMQQGAANFLIKSTDPSKIAEELKATIYSQYGIAALHDEPLPDDLGIIGTSPSLLSVIDTINRMRTVDSTVLISGESGTGKELVARALHKLSPRAGERFCAINCGAIPENLLETELFGHKKSAFTDAKADRKGFFEVCSDGTLLLDEIGEMPLQLQVKLLRVLQEREVTPVGSSDAIPVRTRVIASTNRDLETEIQKGRFREDLFYRISVLRITLPPLRERKEDIALLANYFIKRFNERFNKDVKTPSHEVVARLQSFPWPGNIRELQNAIERGVVLTRDKEIHVDDLFQQGPRPVTPQSAAPVAGEPLLEFHQAKSRFERDYLSRLLKMSHGNISEAARISGEYRTKLYRLLKRHHMDSERYKGSAVHESAPPSETRN